MKRTEDQLSNAPKIIKIERANQKLQLHPLAPGGQGMDLTDGCGPPLRARIPLPFSLIDTPSLLLAKL